MPKRIKCVIVRNKAKNALSLAGPISWLGGAKIGKFWEMQGEKQKTATICLSFQFEIRYALGGELGV